MMKKLLKNLILGITLIASSMAFAQVNLTVDSAPTSIGLNGELTNPIIFTISGLNMDLTNVYNLRIYEEGSNVTTGTGIAASLQAEGFDLNSATADVTEAGNFQTATTVVENTITRQYTVNKVVLTDIAAPLVAGAKYEVAVRLVWAGNGTNVKNVPAGNGAPSSATGATIVDDVKHILFQFATQLTAEEATASTKDFNIVSKSIYPNPVKDILTINSNVKTESYKVVNILGNTIKNVKATGTLDVSDLSKGVYFLVTDSGTAKFIKK